MEIDFDNTVSTQWAFIIFYIYQFKTWDIYYLIEYYAKLTTANVLNYSDFAPSIQKREYISAEEVCFTKPDPINQRQHKYIRI